MKKEEKKEKIRTKWENIKGEKKGKKGSRKIRKMNE